MPSNTLKKRVSKSEISDKPENGDQADAAKSEEKDKLLVDNPSKWRNFMIRTASTALMIGAFACIIYFGHTSVTLLILALQIAMFKEITDLAKKRLQEQELPFFASLNWYFLFSAMYYFLVRALRFKLPHVSNAVVVLLLKYHSFISFCIYLLGFVLFVFSLQKGYYKYQFRQFVWTHMTIMFIIVTTMLIIHTTYEGLIWFLMPASLIIVNDISAYIFGFFFGRTPLIQLSPKKTWEGFLGALFSTIIFGFIITSFLSQFQSMVCGKKEFGRALTCVPSPIFTPQEYLLPPFLDHFINNKLGLGIHSFHLAPVHIHVFFMSVFASLIAPFGGFFASGFKRAFKIKDFSDTIPGHGGITDRMDCQILMGMFVYVYYQSFIRAWDDIDGVMLRLLRLNTENQLIVYEKLSDILRTKGAI